jgi:steroid delta-isomerase-like uncharacterized protein
MADIGQDASTRNGRGEQRVVSGLSAPALISAYYDAFNAADWDAMTALLADEVAHDVNEGKRRIGKALFREFLVHMDRCYRETVSDLVVLASPDGRRAAAEFAVSGVYLATDGALPPARGQSYSLPGGAFFEIADGRICRITTYYNLRDWLDQVA